MDALPDWLTPLPDAETMRRVDRWAIEEQGVDSLELMERAGAAVAAAVERLVPDGPVAVLCGKGNNGGDGLVVARLLRDAGREVTVVCIAPPQELTGDARANLERLPGDGRRSARRQLLGAPSRASGSPARRSTAAPRSSTRCSAPASAASPTARWPAAIAAIDRAAAPVVSVDVPSGVDASTGVVAGAAVRATVTVTFHAAKPGLWIRPGKAYAGAVEVADIGIPRGAPGASSIGLIEASVARAAAAPRRILDQVRLRPRPRRRRLARADRRAGDGRARSDARRRRIRDRLRARRAAGDARRLRHPGADDPRPARSATAR